MKNVLLMKAGDANNAVRNSLGDYDRWFMQTIGHSGMSVRYDVVQAHLGEKLPDAPTSYDAIIMTGSPLSVTEPADWMKRSAEFMRTAADKKVPVLGVCFGMQLLGWSFGGRVVRNPNGREIGTIQVALTKEGEADPLFAGMPSEIFVQATHEDIVVEAPRELRPLATNANTALQAFAVGKYIRAVQFHPEVQPDAMAALIKARAEKLDAEGVARGLKSGERVTKLLAGVRPTKYGQKILENFLERLS